MELKRKLFELETANQTINENEERFRNLIRQSPVATATLKGRDLLVDCVNDKILKIWGKDESILGMPLQRRYLN